MSHPVVHFEIGCKDKEINVGVLPPGFRVGDRIRTNGRDRYRHQGGYRRTYRILGTRAAPVYALLYRD